METPTTNHITKIDYEFIYEPAEDTFLLLDAIEADLNYINNDLKPQICVEIGSGSGVIITAVSKKLQNNSFCFATDINYKACKITKQTAFHNSTRVDTLQMDLINCLLPNSIDLLIFNPPYVLTPDNQDEYKIFSNTNHDIVHSWAGGHDGCTVIHKLLNCLHTVLSPNGGVLYLLVLKENKPQDIIELLLKKKQFSAQIFMERKIPGEHLYILKIIRKHVDR